VLPDDRDETRQLLAHALRFDMPALTHRDIHRIEPDLRGRARHLIALQELQMLRKDCDLQFARSSEGGRGTAEKQSRARDYGTPRKSFGFIWHNCHSAYRGMAVAQVSSPLASRRARQSASLPALSAVPAEDRAALPGR